MKVLKIINNNVISSLGKEGKELVLMGKGIGFQKKSGDTIDESKIEKIFSLPKEHTTKFEELVADIPYDHMQVAQMVIQYAKDHLKQELNQNIYITLTDHMNFAVERQKKGVVLQNALLWEIRKYYKEEFHIGCRAIELVKEKLGIELPEDEAGFIALHIVNAETGNGLKAAQRVPTMMKDIINIVTYTFGIKLNEDSLAYERFVTHLKFFVQRTVSHAVYEDVDEEMFSMFKRRYPKAYECVLKIKKYVSERCGYEVPDAELIYLMAHISRVTKDSK